MPFPSEDVTPPVTNMYLVADADKTVEFNCFNKPAKLINKTYR